MPLKVIITQGLYNEHAGCLPQPRSPGRMTESHRYARISHRSFPPQETKAGNLKHYFPEQPHCKSQAVEKQNANGSKDSMDCAFFHFTVYIRF